MVRAVARSWPPRPGTLASRYSFFRLIVYTPIFSVTTPILLVNSPIIFSIHLSMFAVE